MELPFGESWREWRDQVLNQAHLIVIKVGSAVLTCKEGLDLRVINRLADQISLLQDQGRKFILVSSGAVAAGRQVLGLANGVRNISLQQAAAAVGQSRLMHSYDEAFARYNKITAQVLLAKDDLRVRYRFVNAKNTFELLLQKNVIPIVNENDAVVVDELRFGDNDFLATLILNLVPADLFINLTSAKGVYSSNPDLDPEAKKIDWIFKLDDLDLKGMCKGSTNCGSGGMYSKLLAASRAAKLGVPTLIVSGLEPFVLEKVFSGEDLGSWIVPQKRVISRKKFWLAYNLDPVGDVVIDKGAKKALLESGRSLLPAGIVRVKGRFAAGEPVRIIEETGKVLGVGLTNYSSDELQKIAGRQTKELSIILGHDIPGGEAIHRDNLYLGSIQSCR